MASEL